jgi:hypothetical protein
VVADDRFRGGALPNASQLRTSTVGRDRPRVDDAFAKHSLVHQLKDRLNAVNAALAKGVVARGYAF